MSRWGVLQYLDVNNERFLQHANDSCWRSNEYTHTVHADRRQYWENNLRLRLTIWLFALCLTIPLGGRARHDGDHEDWSFLSDGGSRRRSRAMADVEWLARDDEPSDRRHLPITPPPTHCLAETHDDNWPPKVDFFLFFQNVRTPLGFIVLFFVFHSPIFKVVFAIRVLMQKTWLLLFEYYS